VNALLLSALLLALASGSPPAEPPARPPGGGGVGGGSATLRAPARRALEDEVAALLRRDERLAVAALWSDSVPAGASQALGGPALGAFAEAAAGRRREGVRLRMLRSTLTVVSLRRLRQGGVELRARWRQELEPASLDGAPLGWPLALEEDAELLLRRLPGSGRLVVWKVELLR